MEFVKLKNGSEEPTLAVATIMLSLKHLMKPSENVGNILAFCDLAMKCRNPDYQVSGQALDTLQRLGLLESDGGVHDITKNIVLSAAEGDGIDMKLVSPIASSAAA